MPLFNPGKVKSPPDDIASDLLSEVVENEELAHPTEVTMSEEQRRQYVSRCKLYRFALVLMTLLNEEKTNPKVLHVRQSIEQRVFGLPDDQSRALLDQVQSAMSDLQALLAPTGKPKELSWARSWFQEMNVEADNPVDLAFFASCWMDQYVAVTETLRDFEITT